MTAKTRYAKTWLAGTALALAGTALAIVMAANTALAADIYVANLTGAGANPSSGLTNTGTAYLAVNNDNIANTVWIRHDITNLPTYAKLFVPGYSPYQFEDRQITNDWGPQEFNFAGYAVTDALRAGQHFLELYNTSYPNGAIGGFFTQVVFPTATDNRNRASLASILNRSGGTHEFNRVLVALARVPTASQFDAYDQMSGRTLYSQSVQILDSMAGFQNSLFSHANDVPPDLGTFSVFARGGYAVGKRDDTRDQAGASLSRPYIIGGVDTSFLPNASAGIAVAYADGTDKFTGGLGRTSVSTIAGLGYVSLNVARVVVQAVVGYGQSEIATVREMPLMGLAPTSSHNGNGWSMAARVVMPFAIAPNTSISPYLAFDTQNASIDSYTEEGPGRFTPNDYKDKDLAVELGGLLKASVGPAAHVRLEAGYRQSIDKGGKAIQTLYVGAPLKFTTAILGRSPNAVRAGVAISGDFGDSLSGEVGYQGYMSGRMNAHAFEARLTFKM